MLSCSKKKNKKIKKKNKSTNKIKIPIKRKAKNKLDTPLSLVKLKQTPPPKKNTGTFFGHSVIHSILKTLPLNVVCVISLFYYSLQSMAQGQKIMNS